MSDETRYEPAEKIFVGDEPGADDYVTKYDRKNTEAERKKRIAKRKAAQKKRVLAARERLSKQDD